MQILLAGGAGFIGSHLAAHQLAQGHRVVIVDNFLTGVRANLHPLRARYSDRDLRIVRADIRRLPELHESFDAILHLASPASPVDYFRHPIDTLETGALGTHGLLKLARRHEARFLLASTSEVYGDPQIHPQPESYWGHVNPVGPRSVYDEAKRYAEALATAYARHAGVRVRIARIFNTYGPRMRAHDGRVIPTFVRQALLNRPLPVFGLGRQTRSYCYVDDLVTGLDRLLWSEVEGPVNLGNPEEMTVLDTARTVIELTGSGSSIVFRPPQADDPQLRRPDITRARQLVGWEPKTPLRVGLMATIEDLAERVLGSRTGLAEVDEAS